MKAGKIIATALTTGALLFGASALVPNSDTEAKPDVEVQINGVEVVSDWNTLLEGEIYVDVERYLGMVNKDYQLQGKTITVADSEPVSIVREGSSILAPLAELAPASGSEEITYENATSAYVLDLPEGAVTYHPPMDNMGQHWVLLMKESGEPYTSAELKALSPKELDELKHTVKFPETTIYGTHEGKLLFYEQMVSVEGMNGSVNWTNLYGMRGLPSPSIQHSDMEVQEKGHPGFWEKHYDIHHYFVSHEDHIFKITEESSADPNIIAN